MSIYNNFPKLVLKAKERQLKLGLHPCSKYIVGVTVANLNGLSRPPRNWLRIKTRYDARKPPIHPLDTYEGRDIHFSWEHSCNHKDNHPPFYVFRVDELKTNDRRTEHVNGLSYRFKVSLSAEYRFSVSTPAANAKQFFWNYKAPPLPTPLKLAALSYGNGTFRFDWEQIDMSDEP